MNTSPAQALIKLCQALPKGSRGRAATSEQCNAALGVFGTRVPEWYWELLQSTRLCGSTLRIRSQDGEFDLSFLSPTGMVNEATDAIPGVNVLHLGYVPIAGCATGSGNPYFCQFAQEGSRVVQVDHSIPAELLKHDIPPHGSWPVAPSLSELFKSTYEVH